MYIERIEKKADALLQISRQNDDKSASSSIASAVKAADEDLPPSDLLCPLCKRVYVDAVITPCCSLSFCDSCKFNKALFLTAFSPLFFSFLKGIRTALIESHDHECPSCHAQHVAIDQINPNLYLRNHIKRWHERRNQSYYPPSSQPQHTLEQDMDPPSVNRSNSNEIDEYDTAILSTSSQPSVSSGKSAPIIIKMQPKSQSPPLPAVLTRPADMTFEDEKASDSDHTASRSVGCGFAFEKDSASFHFSQKDVPTNEETIDTALTSTPAESEYLI